MTIYHYLTLSALLFIISLTGIFLNKKNIIIVLMAIELMLLSINFNFITFASFLHNLDGQIFVFFVLTVAASESAIGLAILILLFRKLGSINIKDMNKLKG